MAGLMTENGPIQVEAGTEGLVSNPYAWSNLIDYIWVDQPVYVFLIDRSLYRYLPLL